MRLSPSFSNQDKRCLSGLKIFDVHSLFLPSRNIPYLSGRNPRSPCNKSTLGSYLPSVCSILRTPLGAPPGTFRLRRPLRHSFYIYFPFSALSSSSAMSFNITKIVRLKAKSASLNRLILLVMKFCFLLNRISMQSEKSSYRIYISTFRSLQNCNMLCVSMLHLPYANGPCGLLSANSSLSATISVAL